MNLVQQIVATAENARRVALEAPVHKRQSKACGNSLSGAGQSTGLRARIVELLPCDKEQAVSHGEMVKLLENFPHAYSGVSSSLANLVKTGAAKHIGDKGAYRYYKESN